MAQPITWRNVNAPSDNAAASFFDSGADRINSAFGSLGNALKGVQQDRNAEYQYGVDQNTQAFLDKVKGYTDVNQLQADKASGLFQNLISGYNGDIDRSKTNGAVDAQIKALRDGFTSQVNFDDAVRSKEEADRLRGLKPETDAIALAQAKNQFGVARDRISNSGLNDLEKAQKLAEITQAERAFEEQSYQDKVREYTRTLDDRLNAEISGEEAKAQKNLESINQFYKDNHIVDPNNLTLGQYDKLKAFEQTLERVRGKEEIMRDFDAQQLASGLYEAYDRDSTQSMIDTRLDQSLSTEQQSTIKANVDKLIRDKGYLTLENNIMSTENQQKFGGLNGSKEAGEALKLLVDGDGEPDPDYTQWKSDAVDIATNGIDITVGNESMKVKVPIEHIYNAIATGKSWGLERDSDLRTNIETFLGKEKIGEKYRQAQEIEAHERLLKSGMLAKTNANNPFYRNQVARSILDGASVEAPQKPNIAEINAATIDAAAETKNPTVGRRATQARARKKRAELAKDPDIKAAQKELDALSGIRNHFKRLQAKDRLIKELRKKDKDISWINSY